MFGYLFTTVLDVATNPLTDIGSAIEAVGGWIVSIFSSITGLFWNATTGSLTFVGWLLIVAFGVSCIWCVIKFIKSLVKRG